MMDELERFVLTEDLPKHGLIAGDLGTIVMVHGPEETLLTRNILDRRAIRPNLRI